MPGVRITLLVGTTFVLIVRWRGLGRNIIAGFRSVVGREITGYTQLLEQVRHEVFARLTGHAKSLAANAVIWVGFDSSEMSEVMTEVLAYGTPVVRGPDPAPAQPMALR